MITFCFDHMSAPEVLGYPNLAQPDLDGDAFDITWPRTIPCRLFVYFQRHEISVRQCWVGDAPADAWYPVAVAWYDFSCDYFSLMSPQVLDRLRSRTLKVLFYYHEGDNPNNIKHRIEFLLAKHTLPLDCYLFISANSAADDLDNFYYFSDHEFFFHYINRRQSLPNISTVGRNYKFTALNRTHKWWRASVMTDLLESKLLENSLWSYNSNIGCDDREKDNPIEVDILPGWRSATRSFVSNGPYFCDHPDSVTHNDHRFIPDFLYTDSYCGLVLETHFDADGSGGAFLTEKTYKCLKYGQPFVIVGAPHSLKMLREHGYRVFDSVIDNSYDEIINNTQRWLAVKRCIQDIAARDMHQLYLDCVPDLIHNQQHFNSGNPVQLRNLLAALTAHSYAV